MYHAGAWKPVLPAAASSPPTESPSDKLQPLKLVPNAKEQMELTVSPNERDVSRSRSGSKEPGTSPERSECTGGSDEEEESPVKTLLRLLSSSASPGVQKKQLSKSRSPTDRRKLSRSTSSPRRSTSKSTSRKKQSRFVACMGLSCVSVLAVLKELYLITIRS